MSSPPDPADPVATPPPLTAVLTAVDDSAESDWDNAWVNLTPAFTDPKAVALWQRLAKSDDGKARFFSHKYMLEQQKAVAKRVAKTYRKAQARREPWCLFTTVERVKGQEQSSADPVELLFHGSGDEKPPQTLRLQVRPGPGTIAYRMDQVPLRWLYDPRFIRFLQELVWDVPLSLGLVPTMNYGSGGFSLSAKTYLEGSLLADDIADKLNHPELACWTMDQPRSQARSYRATQPRRAAFADIIQQFWAGAFHPRAIGTLRYENAFLDRGFHPADDPEQGLMSLESGVSGPVGSLEEAFQNNFAFGRCVRRLAQNVHPGGWQTAHPHSPGFRPDQIMDYGESSLSHIRIVGELPTDSDLGSAESARIPEFDAPLGQSLLDSQAAWENRAQYGRTSAQDFVEAVLLEVHRAQYLQKHPYVEPKGSLLQDQLLAESADAILRHGGGARLDVLRKAARAQNLAVSRGHVHSDFIEPELMFWEAWHILPTGEQAAIAREVVRSFCDRVIEAASCDPREIEREAVQRHFDPLAWHRHRIHPSLWDLIEQDTISRAGTNPVLRELRRFREHEALYLSRRPVFDAVGQPAPWAKRP